jgi:hypothetical protein
MTPKWPLVGLFSEHERARRELSAYLDDRLGPDELARLERHLAGCADCRRELEGLRRTVQLLRLVPPVAPPRQFLLPATAATTPRRPLYSPLYVGLRNATGALAALLVAVVAVNIVFDPPTAVAPTERGADLSASSATAPVAPQADPFRGPATTERQAAPAQATPAPPPAGGAAPQPAQARPAAGAPAADAAGAKPAAAPALATPAPPGTPAPAARSAPAEGARPAATEPPSAAGGASPPSGPAPLQAPAPAVGGAATANEAAPATAQPATTERPALTAGYAATPAEAATAAALAAPEQAAKMVPAAPSTPDPSPLDLAAWALAGLALFSAAATAAVWYRDRRRA